MGSTLAQALHRAGHKFTMVMDCDLESARETAQRVDALDYGVEPTSKVGASDIVLIAVSDSEIRPVSERLAASGILRTGQVVCHASGILPATELSAVKNAVLIASFHPMFSVAQKFSGLPGKPYFGLEGEPGAVARLSEMAEDCGWGTVELKPGQKALYHAACVLTTGMNAALLGLAQKIFRDLGFGDKSLGMVRSLAESANDNIMRTEIASALTGPLVRGQVDVVAEHLRALESADSQAASVYRALGLAMLGIASHRMDEKVREEMERMLRSI